MGGAPARPADRAPARPPLPDPDFQLLRGFWAGAARGELCLPRCATCESWCWYPRPLCPGCGGDELSWTRTSGRGTIHSFAVVRRALHAPFAPFVPYATGLVALAEDPAVRLVTRFVDCEPEALRVDMAVRAVFRPFDFPGAASPVLAPFFTPVSDRSPR
jgi:uncharacterized OB-fold protein